jgi:phage terminase large subunit-like protein
MLADMPDLSRWMELDKDFATLAHRHQEPPTCANNGGPWTTWLALGGRGAGKTRLGAEFVRALVHGHGPYADARYGSIALIGESEHDVREVMIEGPAGILRTSPRSQRPVWIASRFRLEWRNGAVAEAFSADDPDSLRGPQFDAAWCDELAKWRLRNVDASVPLKMVHATRGKYVRAEPVAALYAQGKVKHAAPMPELEDQMCDFGLSGLSSGASPDRLDALV